MKKIVHLVYPVIALVACLFFKITVDDIVMFGLLLRFMNDRGIKLE